MGKRKRNSDSGADVGGGGAKESAQPSSGDLTDFGAFGSSESVKSELSMFDGHSYQVTHLKAQWLPILPQNQYTGTNGTDIIFKIRKSPGWYLSLRDSYITVQVSIEKADGTDVDTDIVGFENFASGTLFKDVSFLISNQTKLNEPKFALHANKNDVAYKINMEKMCLYLRQVTVSPQVMLGHAKGLQHHNIIIPFNAHKVFTKMIVAGVLSDVSINFLEGIYPKLVIVGLVDHAAYTGTYNKSPYNFQHFNVSECALTSNGQSIPSTPYRPNFDKKMYAKEYFNMFQQLSRCGMFADDNGITLEDWADGKTLFTFNLAPDLAVTGHAQAVRYTNINIELSFAKATPKNLQRSEERRVGK